MKTLVRWGAALAPCSIFLVLLGACSPESSGDADPVFRAPAAEPGTTMLSSEACQCDGCADRANPDRAPHRMKFEVRSRVEEDLTTLRVVLIRPDAGPYAIVSGDHYRGTRAVQAGDELLAYVRGADPVRLRIADPKRPPAVTFDTAAARCRVRVNASEPVPIRVWHSLAVDQHPRVLLDKYDFPVDGSGAAIAVGSGLYNIIRPIQDTEHVAWPIQQLARPDWEYLFHRVRLARRTVDCDGSETEIRRMRGLLCLDWSEPPQADRHFLDGLIHWQSRGGGAVETASGTVTLANVAPPVAHHLFLIGPGGGSAYLHVASGEEVPRVRFGPAAASPLPEVAGERAPDGTVLLPGRLDLDTVCRIVMEPYWRKRLAAEVVDGRVVGAVPQSAVITLWHPKHGVAYLSRDSGKAVWCSGGIRVSTGPGTKSLGAVVVYPSWEGSGGIRRVRMGALPPHPSPGSESLTIHGLPPGFYVVQGQLTVEGPGGSETIKINQSVRVADTIVRLPLQVNGNK